MSNQEPKQIKCYCGHTTMCDCGEEPKQETLEEASWIFNPLKKLDGEFLRDAFVKGAKWQQERMYSEEDRLKRSDKLWKKLVKELSVLNDNNYAARRLFDYIERHYRQPPQQPPITNN